VIDWAERSPPDVAGTAVTDKLCGLSADPTLPTPRNSGHAVYRSQALLRIESTASCPVTLPNGNRPPGQPRSVSWYGNGLPWAGLTSDGAYAVSPDRVDADGSIGNKLLWVTTPPVARTGALG